MRVKNGVFDRSCTNFDRSCICGCNIGGRLVKLGIRE